MNGCTHSRSVVVDSRPIAEGVRRRRQCEICNERFTTIEITIEAQKGVTVLESLKEKFGKTVYRKDLNKAIKLMERLRDDTAK